MMRTQTRSAREWKMIFVCRVVSDVADELIYVRGIIYYVMIFGEIVGGPDARGSNVIDPDKLSTLV